MATIVTRAGKGSPLTNTELDSNFSNLNTDKAELSGSTFSGAVEITNVDGLVAPRVYVGEGKSSGTRIQLSRSGTTNKLFSFTSSTSATPLDIVVGATTNALSIDASANVSIPNGNLDVTGSVTSTGSNASTSDWVNEGISSKFVINAANRTYGGLVFKDSAIKGAGVGFRYDGAGYKLELGTSSSTSSGISTHLTIDRLGAIVTSGHLDVGNNLAVSGSVTAPQLAITSASTADTVTLTRGTNGQNNMLKFVTGSTADWIVGERNDSTSDFRFYSYGTSSDVLSISRANGNVNIGSNLMVGSTTAPSSKFVVSDGGNTGFEINPQHSNSRNVLFSYDRAASAYKQIIAFASDYKFNIAGDTKLEINSSGNVQARRARSNTAGEVALSLQPSDSTIHYGLRIDSATNSFNLDRVDSAGQLLRVDASGNATFSGSVSAEDNIYLTDSGTVRAKLLLNASDRDNVELRAESLGSTMKLFTVATEALAIDASQNVNISNGGLMVGSTTAPDSKLTVNTTTTGDGIELQSSEVSIAKLSRTVVSSNVVASLDGVSGRPIHVGGVVNEDVILANAGGNVGIGSSTGASAFGTKLFVEDSGSGLAIFQRTGSGGLTIAADNDGPILAPLDNADSLRIFTGGQEAARFDASQNFLVGKTSTTFSVQGTVLNANGTIDSTRSGDAPLYLNRLSNSGNIIAMYQDSVAKGNISVSSFGMGFGAVSYTHLRAHETS